MRHPLTAALPAVLVALAACSSDSLTGPSSSRPGKADLPGTPTTSTTATTSSTPGTSSTSGATSGANAWAGGGAGGSGAGSAGTFAGSSAGSAGSSGSTDDAGSTGSSSTFAGGGAAGGGSTSAGGSSGNGASSAVTVAGAFQVLVPGSSVIVGYRTAPVPSSAGGECGRDPLTNEPNGTWTKTTSGTTSTHPLHTHCTIRETTPERTITVTVAESATLVQAPSGNISLNLRSSCPVGVSDPSCDDRHVHYRKSGDVTNGAGLVAGLGSDGSLWTIDLSQIAHAGSSRAATADGIALRSYTALTATSATGLTTGAARFAW